MPFSRASRSHWAINPSRVDIMLPFSSLMFVSLSNLFADAFRFLFSAKLPTLVTAPPSIFAPTPNKPLSAFPNNLNGFVMTFIAALRIISVAFSTFSLIMSPITLILSTIFPSVFSYTRFVMFAIGPIASSIGYITFSIAVSLMSSSQFFMLFFIGTNTSAVMTLPNLFAKPGSSSSSLPKRKFLNLSFPASIEPANPNAAPPIGPSGVKNDASNPAPVPIPAIPTFFLICSGSTSSEFLVILPNALLKLPKIPPIRFFFPFSSNSSVSLPNMKFLNVSLCVTKLTAVPINAPAIGPPTRLPSNPPPKTAPFNPPSAAPPNAAVLFFLKNSCVFWEINPPVRFITVVWFPSSSVTISSYSSPNNNF